MHDLSHVHLGCDTGEAVAGPGRNREIALLSYVSAVSIACGGHSGDRDSMHELITQASAQDCIVGAHPSYPDRKNFGRRALDIDLGVLESSLRDQLAMFAQIVEKCSETVSFIKAHGALYHTVARDPDFARWYWDVCASVIENARFVGPFNSPALDELRAAGVPVFTEGFCDRVYEDDGTLRSRNLDCACIIDPKLAAEQAERLIRESGCDFLCVHSDTENAFDIAKAVRGRLFELAFDS